MDPEQPPRPTEAPASQKTSEDQQRAQRITALFILFAIILTGGAAYVILQGRSRPQQPEIRAAGSPQNYFQRLIGQAVQSTHHASQTVAAQIKKAKELAGKVKDIRNPRVVQKKNAKKKDQKKKHILPRKDKHVPAKNKLHLKPKKKTVLDNKIKQGINSLKKQKAEVQKKGSPKKPLQKVTATADELAQKNTKESLKKLKSTMEKRAAVNALRNQRHANHPKIADLHQKRPINKKQILEKLRQKKNQVHQAQPVHRKPKQKRFQKQNVNLNKRVKHAPAAQDLKPKIVQKKPVNQQAQNVHHQAQNQVHQQAQNVQKQAQKPVHQQAQNVQQQAQNRVHQQAQNVQKQAQKPVQQQAQNVQQVNQVKPVQKAAQPAQHAQNAQHQVTSQNAQNAKHQVTSQQAREALQAHKKRIQERRTAHVGRMQTLSAQLKNAKPEDRAKIMQQIKASRLHGQMIHPETIRLEQMYADALLREGKTKEYDSAVHTINIMKQQQLRVKEQLKKTFWNAKQKREAQNAPKVHVQHPLPQDIKKSNIVNAPKRLPH